VGARVFVWGVGLLGGPKGGVGVLVWDPNVCFCGGWGLSPPMGFFLLCFFWGGVVSKTFLGGCPVGGPHQTFFFCLFFGW